MLSEEFDNFFNNSTKKNISVGSTEWEYFVTGTGDKTVLILTGGGSIAESAFMYINSLASKFKVITPNIPAIKNVEECLFGLNAILQQEGVSKVHLLGFSMGGMLSQCFVRLYPNIVEKLVLFVSMLPSTDYAIKYSKYKKAISIVPDFLFRAISKYSLKKQILLDKNSANTEDVNFWIDFFKWEFDSGKMNKKLLLSTTDVLIDYFQNYHFESTDLDRWEGKILIIESEKDEVISSEERQRFKDTYPKARLVTQQGSGHFGEGLLNPYKDIQIIKDFFNE